MELDLTKEKDVIDFLMQSETEKDWNLKCNAIIKANGNQYPSFWYRAIECNFIYQKASKNFTS